MDAGMGLESSENCPDATVHQHHRRDGIEDPKTKEARLPHQCASSSPKGNNTVSNPRAAPKKIQDSSSSIQKIAEETLLGTAEQPIPTQRAVTVDTDLETYQSRVRPTIE